MPVVLRVYQVQAVRPHVVREKEKRKEHPVLYVAESATELHNRLVRDRQTWVLVLWGYTII